MLLWDGVCSVHDSIQVESVVKLKKDNPGVPLIAHPECNAALLAVADFIGSTKAMLNYIKVSDSKKFIVATEMGIMYEMKKNNPDKEFLAVPVDDIKSCGCVNCEYMKLNTLEKLYNCLLNESPEIEMDSDMIESAKKPIVKMLEMSRELGIIK